MSFLKKIIVKILTWESKLILRKYKPFVVAITGSVGKTSTKDAIYEVLKRHSIYARKSEKSLNSEIGLPLTIIGVGNAWYNPLQWLSNIIAGLNLILKKSEYPDCLVLEIGADHPNDIKKVVKWLHPDIAVITKISEMPVHVEFFSSPEEVFEEKSALAEAVKKDGTLVLYSDDERMNSIANKVKEKGIKVLSYGINKNAEIRGVLFDNLYEASPLKSGIEDEQNLTIQKTGKPIGISFDVVIGENSYPVKMKNVLGSTYIYPTLSAIAVAKAKNIAIQEAIADLSEYIPPRGRMNIIQGLNDTILIDDTYNASPDAVLSALKTLSQIRGVQSKVAILGDMMELGKYSADEHRRIGREVVNAVDYLITVGPRAKMIAEEASKAGMPVEKIKCFDSAREVPNFVISIMKPDDIILIKGSQSVRMERIVKALMLEPNKAGDLLVRQEKEWLEKV